MLTLLKSPNITVQYALLETLLEAWTNLYKEINKIIILDLYIVKLRTHNPNNVFLSKIDTFILQLTTRSIYS